MLATRQKSLPASTCTEHHYSFCCASDDDKETTCRDKLERQAVMVLAAMVEEAVVMPLGPRAMSSLAAYLNTLNSKLLTMVVTSVLSSRPRWLPLEYHWAPLDHDPLLHLVQLLGDRLTVFSYICHPLSREPLLEAIAVMSRLTVLSLPEASDDHIMAAVGASCPVLTVLCVRGSKAVSDDGLRRLLLRRQTYTRSRWRRLFSKWRSLRAPLCRYRPLPTSVTDHTVLLPFEPDQLNSLSGTLTHLDLCSTRVSYQGMAWTRSILQPSAFVDFSHKHHRSLRSNTSLDEQMAGLLVPFTS